MSKALNYQIINNYQLIEISGPDSAKFLQGQLTCDISQANGSSVLIGGYCNVQGRLHATFYALSIGDNYLLICPSDVAQHLLETLSKYSVFFDTQLRLADKQQLLAQETNEPAQHLSQSNNISGTFSQFYLGKLLISVINKEVIDEFTQQHLSEYNKVELGLLSLEQITLGIPMIQPETIESFLPHYIGLSQIGGVNYEKGCYTGQEVVARMHYRGTLKTHPQSAEIHTNSLLKAGSPIHNELGKKVGELINSVVTADSQQALISLADKAINDSLTIENHSLVIQAAES